MQPNTEDIKDAAKFANFAQRVKMKYWSDFNHSSKTVSEENLDNILLLAWEDIYAPNTKDWEKAYRKLWDYNFETSIEEDIEQGIKFIRTLLAVECQKARKEVIDELESNPIVRPDRANYTLQYWIEAKQRQLKKKFNL